MKNVLYPWEAKHYKLVLVVIAMWARLLVSEIRRGWVVRKDMQVTTADFKMKNVLLKSKPDCTSGYTYLCIWDTCAFGILRPEKKYRSIVSTYFKGCHAIIIVFDAAENSTFYCSAISFYCAVKEWYELCLSKAGHAVVLLVGNKNDVEPAVEKEKVEGQAAQVKFMLALANKAWEEALMTLARLVQRRKYLAEHKRSPSAKSKKKREHKNAADGLIYGFDHSLYPFIVIGQSHLYRIIGHSIICSCPGGFSNGQQILISTKTFEFYWQIEQKCFSFIPSGNRFANSPLLLIITPR